MFIQFRTLYLIVGGYCLMKMEPVVIKFGNRKLIITQRGNKFDCTLWELVAESTTYNQITGTNKEEILVLKKPADSPLNFRRIRSWIGEDTAVTLFKGLEKFAKK